MFYDVLQFIDTRAAEDKMKKPKSPDGSVKRRTHIAPIRLQDRALQEMRDDGMCLSMHQPWATLLVAGIKRYCLNSSWHVRSDLPPPTGVRGGHGILHIVADYG